MKKESVLNDYTLKSKKYSGGFKSFLSDWMILFLFVVLLALCCLKPEFRTTTNIMNILRQASFVAIIAMGEFFVILIGEMRDLTTIEAALTAAETGHLVFSTLHTTGADQTLDRIIDVFPPDQQQQIRIQLASVLECIVSQQLLRRADGQGRVAALEVLFANNAIRNLIREGKTYQIPSVMQTSKRLGMQTMDDALYDLCMRKIIDADEAVTYAQDPVSMNKKVTFDLPDF